MLMIGAGTLEFKNSRTSLATAVGSDVPMTSSFYIDNSGNVGIGTTTPSAKLNIASTSQTTKAIIQSVSAANGLGGYLAFNPGGDSTYSKVAIGVYDNYYSSYNRGNIAFMINSAADATEVGFTDTKMYISASGNVGIGRTSLGAKLDVQGTTSDNSAYAFWTRNSSGNVIQYVRNDGQFLVGNGTTDNFVINSSGKVGIGTTIPGDNLHVYSTSDSLVRIQCGDGYEAGIWFYEDASPKWEIYKRSATDDLNFYSSDLNKSVFTLATAGGVGIGTVSPGAELEISSSTASKLLNIKGAAGTGILFVSGSGKVGINTSSPAAPLDVVGSAATTILRNTLASSYGGLRIYNDQNNIFRALEIDYAGSSYASSLITNAPTGEAASVATTGAYPLVLGTSNTARMTITSGGDVGVGTNSPTQKLEVAGYSMAGIDDYRTSIYGNSSGASISFGTTSSLASLGRIGAYGSLFNINSLNEWKEYPTKRL